MLALHVQLTPFVRARNAWYRNRTDSSRAEANNSSHSLNHAFCRTDPARSFIFHMCIVQFGVYHVASHGAHKPQFYTVITEASTPR
eukprot:m.1639637 g.1639637  ORF g.1639637 m.1639637 type:complete len:86 (+) comp36943_c0_seq1:157-414(+)